jgi:NADPH:quinone reductase-like Zn-dependent oxidoreductase
MQAIVYRSYGSPDVLQLEDIDKPAPAVNEVLIRVRAASVNPYDWHFMRGEPYMVRLIAGFPRPKNIRFGADFAGRVEATGAGVTQFKPGDEVYGSSTGAFAEYLCAPAAKLAPRPANISAEQAAAVPIAALTALQSLRDKGRIQPEHNVLVNGAAGGVGTFGVQIAKAYGAHVTGVCSTRNLELVRSIGADAASQRFDLILDAVGNHPLTALRQALAPNGICVMAGGVTDVWLIGPLARGVKALLLSQSGDRKLVGILAQTSLSDFATLNDLMASGKVTPVIDRRYPLSQTADAIRYLETGHARGKVVLQVSEPGA